MMGAFMFSSGRARAHGARECTGRMWIDVDGTFIWHSGWGDACAGKASVWLKKSNKLPMILKST